MKNVKLLAFATLLFFSLSPALYAENNNHPQNKLKERAMAVALELAELNLSNPPPQAKSQSPAPQPKPETVPEITPEPDKKSPPPPTEKGAWTMEKGALYMELYTKYYWHNHRFTGDGKKERWDFDGKYNEIRTELKLEYGLTDRQTLLYSVVAKEAHWKDSFKSCTKKGFVEYWPGIKQLLFTDPFICSLQARAKIPFNYNEHDVPALGTHQLDGEIKLLTAQPWPKLPGYTKFELGFRGRTEEPSNEIPYFFEFGYNLMPYLMVKTSLDGNASLAETGGTNEDWTKYTIGPIIMIKDLFNLEFGFGHTFIGRNTSAAKEIIISISRQW